MRWRLPQTVPRARLQYLRLALPALRGRALTEAVRLQLLPFAGDAAHHTHAWRVGANGQVAVWMWAEDAGPDEATAGPAWPAPLLERPGEGLRLLDRGAGAEAQLWRDGELLQTRWWPVSPSVDDWAHFVRGAGLDPNAHPCPKAEAPQTLPKPPRGWRRASDLPVEAQRGRWLRLAVPAAAGAVLFAALGAHLQIRAGLEEDRGRLERLRQDRQAAVNQRNAYESLRTGFDNLSLLAPKVSQLDLLLAVANSGVFSAPADAVPPVPGNGGPLGRTFTAAAPGAGPPPAEPSPSLSEWDYRDGQLKLTLEIPEGTQAMLDSTRRIEKLRWFSDLRVGLESTNTTLALSMRVAQTPSPEVP